MPPHLLWSQARMLLEIEAEEAHIGEMILPRHLLDALRGPFQLHFELENDILVNDCLGSVSRHLTNDIREVFRGDVHMLSIVIHIPRNFEITFHQHHKAVEEFSYPIRFHFVGAILRITLQVFVKTNEKRFQLTKHQLGDASTLRLVEIHLQQGKHRIDDVRHHRRILTATVFSQGRIHRLLQLQACLTKQTRIIFQYFKLK